MATFGYLVSRRNYALLIFIELKTIKRLWWHLFIFTFEKLQSSYSFHRGEITSVASLLSLIEVRLYKNLILWVLSRGIVMFEAAMSTWLTKSAPVLLHVSETNEINIILRIFELNNSTIPGGRSRGYLPQPKILYRVLSVDFPPGAGWRRLNYCQIKILSEPKELLATMLLFSLKSFQIISNLSIRYFHYFLPQKKHTQVLKP